MIRNFAVNPSGEYVDVPKDDPEDFGYSVHDTADGGMVLGAVQNIDGPRRGDILVIKMSSDE